MKALSRPNGIVTRWSIATKWIMLVTGVFTCTMIYAVVAPQAALLATFGDTLEGPLSEIIVRSWGSMVVLIGAMLIYGAYNPPARRLVLTVAGLGKLVFAGLIVVYGSQYLGKALFPVVFDLLMVVLYAVCLFNTRRSVADALAAGP